MKKKAAAQGELTFSKGEPTLARVVAFYLSDYLRGMGREASTIATQKCALNYLVEQCPPYPTPAEARRAIQKKIDAGLIGETTANTYRKYLSHAYEHARNEWPTTVIRNPCASFPTWKPPRRVPRAMANPEVTFHRLLNEACRDDAERSMLCAFTLLGLRVSETRGVRHAEDFSKDLRSLTIRRQRAQGSGREKRLKTDASYATFEVPELMRGFVRAALRQRSADLAAPPAGDVCGQRVKDASSPYLWPYGQRRLYGSNGLMERCRAVAPEDFPRRVVGRGGVAFHGGRNTLGALLVSKGASTKDGQKALRHASETTTAGYFENWTGAKTNNEKLKEVQQLLATPPAAARPGLRVVSKD